MSVQEIKAAITRLAAPELSRLAAWFEEYRADLWDQQIEADAPAGRMDLLGAQADAVLEKVSRIGKTRLAQECDISTPPKSRRWRRKGWRGADGIGRRELKIKRLLNPES